jgi:hypothetical protein
MVYMAMALSLLHTTQQLEANSSVLNTVKLALSRSESFQLFPVTGHCILVNAKAGTFADPDRILSKVVASTREGRCQIRRMSSRSDAMQQAMVHMRPIEELLWTLAFYDFREQQSLIEDGCRRDDVISLRYWPNFTRVPATSNAYRIAALFKSRPTSIVLAAKILEVDESEILRFYHAASCAGLILRINRPGEQIQLVKHRHQGLIRSLVQRLRRPIAG